MSNPIVLSSRVRLARNYQDLPFDVANKSDAASMCVARTANALRLSGQDAGFQLLRLRDMEDVQRKALAEVHLISKDLLRNPDTAAVLLNEAAGVSIMMNEEDHLRIQAIARGMELQKAADECFRMDDALSRQVSFAYDEQLGYLTACPTNTGTGMRASLLIHLPMLTILKQMGSVGQIVAKVGLTIRGVYGEGSEALGDVYKISNQVTLGRTEQELISTVTALGNQLAEMEQALRAKALMDGSVPLGDVIFRAYGILTNARLLPLNEFYEHWTNLRLGVAIGILDLPIDRVDDLLDLTQPAHLCVWAQEDLTGQALDEARATRVREALG